MVVDSIITKMFKECMMKVVTISGSVRDGNNTNKALVIVESYLEENGVEVQRIDAGSLDLSLPGLVPTDNAQKIQEWVQDADGIIMATPEYHGSYSSVLKLIIDNLGFPSALSGKPVSLLGVAAGQLGAIKALEHLRSVTAHLGMIALPKSVSVANVYSLLSESGEITDEDLVRRIENLGKLLIDFNK